MTVISENGQLKVFLPIKEAASFGIGEILQGKNNNFAKLLLARLLKTAAERVGFNINDADYIIEIYPQKNELIEVVFTPDKTKRILPLKASLKRQIKEYVLEFASAEGLFLGAEILHYSGIAFKSSLYLFNGNYRLLIKIDNEKSEPLFLELADRVFKEKKEYAVTAEYGREICDENAVNRLAKALI